MTIIKVLKQNEDILKISISGHTGFAEQGSDILCASISSIIQTAALGMKNLVSSKTIIKRNDSKPMFSVEITKDLSSTKYLEAQAILKTAYLGLKDLAKGYSKNIKMEENNNDVY